MGLLQLQLPFELYISNISEVFFFKFSAHSHTTVSIVKTQS